MFQKIVTHIAIDFRADGVGDVTKIDDTNLDVFDFCLSERKRIDLRQGNRNLSTCALAFFCPKNFDIQLLREFGGKQRSAGAGVQNKVERTDTIHAGRKQNEWLCAPCEAEFYLCASR